MKATLRLVGLVLVLLAPVLWLYVTPVTAQEWAMSPTIACSTLSGSEQLADVLPYLQWLALQSAQPGQSANGRQTGAQMDVFPG